MWNSDLLNYDYVGAPWPNQWVNRVGCGGFSLRSRKLLEASATLPYIKSGKSKEDDNEDYYMCVTMYEHMINSGIKFAPVNLAREFCVEHPIPENPHKYNDISTYKSFAFHGIFNSGGMDYINRI